MKLPKWTIVAAFVLALLIILLACQIIIFQPKGQVAPQPSGRTLLEFDIQQDKELILLTTFAEPPQFAIWLEDPTSHQLKTIFVTYRSATGDMVGKAECPGCLPRWFEVYEQETGRDGLPTQDHSAPAAVTVATPQDEHFKITYEVKLGSRWICWIEMNLAGDFNEKYQEYDEKAKIIDWDFSGQPPLIYRAEITAIPGKTIVPQLYGQSVLDSPDGQMVQPVTDDITTAKSVFNSIRISVVQPQSTPAN